MNEQGKKQACNERILQIEHGTFFLVFSINGSMGREYQKFTRVWHYCYMKRETFRSRFQVIGSEKKVSFGLLKSSLLCLRGSRTVCRKIAEFEIGVDVSHTVAKI